VVAKLIEPAPSSLSRRFHDQIAERVDTAAQAGVDHGGGIGLFQNRRPVDSRAGRKVETRPVNGRYDIALMESFRRRVAAFKAKDRAESPWARPIA
jgi:hypothetical protein